VSDPIKNYFVNKLNPLKDIEFAEAIGGCLPVNAMMARG